MRTHVAALASLALVIGAGCRKKVPEAEPVFAPAPVVIQPQAEATPPAEQAGPVELDSIYFDFDRSEVRPDQVAAMRQNLAELEQHPRITVRIEGHCDERGTTEYNLALGERRAASARAWLVGQGIAPSRIATLSYGEERPVAQGHDERAWQQNRRAEFRVTGGQEALAQW